MEREYLLTITAFAFGGAVVWLLALPAGWAWLSVRGPERVAWWRLVLPLLGGAVVLAFLVGWATQEADPADERADAFLYLLAVLSASVVIRASVRATKALRHGTGAHVPIGTIGIVRPRIVVTPEFRESVSDDVFAAALAHEAAHARSRDPLRIWLAQLAADLQWPAPGTARRFAEWLVALEAKRDDEAVSSGISGEALAEAILTAARLHRVGAVGVIANAHGAGEGVAWRVRRLLADAGGRSSSRARAPWLAPLSCCALIAGALWLGIHFGDAVLGVLPGIGS